MPPEKRQIDYAARRRSRAAARQQRTGRKVPLYVLAGAVGLIVVLAVAEAAASAGRIHPGVSVSGVDVGGLIPEKAAVTLTEQLSAKASEPVTVSYGEETWSVTNEEIGLDFDFDAAVAQAMAVGREGGVLKAAGGRLSAWAGGVELVVPSSYDPDKMGEVLETVAAGTDVAPKDAKVRIKGTEATVVPGKSGLAMNREKAAAMIVAAMLASDRQVEAPVETAAVAITDQEAEQAARVAEQMMSSPVKVTFDKKAWTFEPSDIAKWIEFRRSDESTTGEAVEATPSSTPSQITLHPFVAADLAGKTVIPKVGAKVGHAARDARFSTRSGEVTIIPSRNGVGPDIESLAERLTRDLAVEDSSRTVELRTTTIKPKLTTQKAREMGIDERISRYTTEYVAGNKPRVNNIHLLGDALDGTLIAPGKTFSFNKAVGQRTADKGYEEAPAIVNGKLVPQLGGGICQVGTTIFNSVYESGLPVVERRNHSFYISHYPKGRDATVSWGGPDFKFKNTTDDWILISVSYTSSSITISLYGKDPGYEVESEVGEWRNRRDFKTEKIKDKTLKEGTTVIEDAGIDGRTITVKRIVSRDGEVIRTDSFTSVYKPKVEVVRVGTKKPKKQPATTPVEGEQP